MHGNLYKLQVIVIRNKNKLHDVKLLIFVVINEFLIIQKFAISFL